MRLWTILNWLQQLLEELHFEAAHGGTWSSPSARLVTICAGCVEAGGDVHYEMHGVYLHEMHAPKYCPDMEHHGT